MTKPEITDAELRAMRDTVYPAGNEKQIQTDESWAQVKDNWRRDEAWLVAECEKIKSVETSAGKRIN